MEPTDITIEILRDIRDDIRTVRDDVSVVRADLNVVRADLNVVRTDIQGIREEARVTNERVGRIERRQSEAEIRIGTELVGIAGVMREMRDLLRDDVGLRARVNDHEQRLASIEKHLQ